ncbi:hypothetical protein OF83DRAFT_1177997 [Amylostereum chailletii]|nr:hypothetical protein OF83DRAFT_1177997 [Amylostereum chailletii]
MAAPLSTVKELQRQISSALVVTKLIHVIGGIVLWEFVSTFNYEWSVIRGKRPYKWTIWVYSGCRISALVAFFTLFAEEDGKVIGNCKATFIVFLTSAYISLALASIIIILRIKAIWECNRWIMGISYSVLVISVILNIRYLFLANAEYDPVLGACLSSEESTYKCIVSAAGILISDLVLLVIMLLGLWRMEEARKFGLCGFLYRQGIVWIAVATLAETPSVVFLALNLGDPWNLMFQPFELAVMTVCATRMYRSLFDYDANTRYRSSLLDWADGPQRPMTSIRFEHDTHASHTLDRMVSISIALRGDNASSNGDTESPTDGPVGKVEEV